MKEYLLAINDFNLPKSLDGIETDIILIIRLLLLDPGTYQSHPNMGVGLVSKWRYSDAERLSDLEEEIQKQITAYLPYLAAISVSVKYQKKYIVIDIDTSSYVLRLRTNEEQTTLYISDILV